MKKSILVSMLALFVGLGFSISASAQNLYCDDLVWSAEILANNPNIGDYCLEVTEKDGQTVARFRTRVVRQSVNSTIVQWQLPDGSWSSSERRYPEKDFVAHLGDDEVRILDLAPRQEVNVYVPRGTAWSVPTASAAPSAAPAAAATTAAATTQREPEPQPEPEPEPAPTALPTTATQVSMLALLGGLMILLGGAVSVLRSRL